MAGDLAGATLGEVVLYELHVGTFTSRGTFDAAIDRLDHLAGLGVTAVEIMPVADFPGRRNWGYDGVFPFAPDASYGRPEDLQRFVDAAHARGIAVLLDVVYNHFGPEGNYLPALAPQFFTERHHTPWGAAINFDDAGAREVREFFIENALYWLREFRSTACASTPYTPSSTTARRTSSRTSRDAYARRSPTAPCTCCSRTSATKSGAWSARDAPPPLFTAQWNDDVHHVLHVRQRARAAATTRSTCAIPGCSAVAWPKASPSRARSCASRPCAR